LTVGTVNAEPGSRVSLSVYLSGASDVSALTVDFLYNPAELSYEGIDKTGTLVEDFILADANELVPGSVRLAALQVMGPSISTSGVLIRLLFTVGTNVSGTAPVQIESLKDDLTGANTVAGGVVFGSQAASPTSIPTRTSAPTQLPASTPSATSTPAPIPTPSPTPSVSAPHVFVFDNAQTTDSELTGETDFDPVESRNLTIRWDAPVQDATDWHLYVRKGFGGMKYLGHTGNGEARQFDWYANAPGLGVEFRQGPDFNSVYSFRVVRFDTNVGPDDYFDQEGLTGFNTEGGNPVSLSRPASPNLDAGEIRVYDDILGGNDLAPSGSSGSDTDPESWRSIQIAWNFGVDVSTVNQYHVEVKVDNGEWEYLGQTGSGDINYFWWTSTAEFKTAEEFAQGPMGGHQYQFRVTLLPLAGNRRNLTSGILSYFVTSS